MTTLYHSTLRRYEPGEELPALSRQVENTIAPNTERLIESVRPADRNSRLTSYFLTKVPEQALVVQLGMRPEIRPSDVIVYEAEVDDVSTQCPMILFQAVTTLLQSNRPTDAENVARSYWTAAQGGWYFYEVLAPTIRIHRQVIFDAPEKDLVEKVNSEYRADVPLVLALRRQLKSS